MPGQRQLPTVVTEAIVATVGVVQAGEVQQLREMRKMEAELVGLNDQFERQKEAVARKHASEIECLRSELRQVNEERVVLLTQNETLQLELERARE